MTTEQLDKAVELQKAFGKLYRESGIISLEPDANIHMEVEDFFSTFITGGIKETIRNCTQYPFQYSAQYKDVMFFCIDEKRHEI